LNNPVRLYSIKSSRCSSWKRSETATIFLFNKIKKENKDAVDATKKDSISLSSSILTDSENKEKEQLSYYEKQVLKELKGIKKASKNILKSMKKFSS